MMWESDSILIDPPLDNYCSSITPVAEEKQVFLILRDKFNKILRFIASVALDCNDPLECYNTGSENHIRATISHRDHNQLAWVVSFGKGFDGVDGWYPKAFHKFENTSAVKYFETVPLLKYQKTIRTVIGK